MRSRSSSATRLDALIFDAFEAMMVREDRAKGFFVSFDYSTDAMTEMGRFFEQTGKVIVPFTVAEILGEQIAQKLA
jgi:hypothetical protein